jgi:membrane associated rhomboid family serine protease
MIPLGDDNPSQLRPVVTVSLIVVCTLVFLWQLGHGPEAGQGLVLAYGLVPSVLFGINSLPPELAVVPPALTVVTSMFLHGGWLHLIGNMLYLWIFGDNVEDSMGHGRFIVFYLLCGTVAALMQAIPDPHSELPMIGASGAISGVLGAYLVQFPRASVRVAVVFVFITITRMPAAVVLGLWFVLQALHGLFSGDAGGGVAFRAHIFGFLAGMALVRLFRRPDFRPMWMG